MKFIDLKRLLVVGNIVIMGGHMPNNNY